MENVRLIDCFCDSFAIFGDLFAFFFVTSCWTCCSTLQRSHQLHECPPFCVGVVPFGEIISRWVSFLTGFLRRGWTLLKMLPTSVKYPSELQKERKRNRRNSSEDFKNLEGENMEITATFSQLLHVPFWRLSTPIVSSRTGLHGNDTSEVFCNKL